MSKSNLENALKKLNETANENFKQLELKIGKNSRPVTEEMTKLLAQGARTKKQTPEQGDVKPKQDNNNVKAEAEKVEEQPVIVEEQPDASIEPLILKEKEYSCDMLDKQMRLTMDILFEKFGYSKSFSVAKGETISLNQTEIALADNLQNYLESKLIETAETVAKAEDSVVTELFGILNHCNLGTSGCQDVSRVDELVMQVSHLVTTYVSLVDTHAIVFEKYNETAEMYMHLAKKIQKLTKTKEVQLIQAIKSLHEFMEKIDDKDMLREDLNAIIGKIESIRFTHNQSLVYSNSKQAEGAEEVKGLDEIQPKPDLEPELEKSRQELNLGQDSDSDKTITAQLIENLPEVEAKLQVQEQPLDLVKVLQELNLDNEDESDLLELSDLDKTITAQLSEKLQGLEENVQEKEQQPLEMQQELDEAQEKLGKMNQLFDDLNVHLKLQEEKIQKGAVQRQALEQELEKRQTEFENLQRELEMLKNQPQGGGQELSLLQEKAEKAELYRLQLEKDLGKIQEQLDTTSKELQQVRARYHELNESKEVVKQEGVNNNRGQPNVDHPVAEQKTNRIEEYYQTKKQKQLEEQLKKAQSDLHEMQLQLSKTQDQTTIKLDIQTEHADRSSAAFQRKMEELSFELEEKSRRAPYDARIIMLERDIKEKQDKIDDLKYAYSIARMQIDELRRVRLASSMCPPNL